MSKLNRKVQFARERGIHVFDAQGKANTASYNIYGGRLRVHYVLRFPRGFNPRMTNRWWTVMIEGDIYPVTGYTRREAINIAYGLALEHAADEPQGYGSFKALQITR